jgi:uncharacterized protein with NRDE domain
VCTLAIYFRMLPQYPLLVAANRDEQYDRPSAPPQVIAKEPRIVAGRDLRAGGTWLGANEHGVLAAILNRRVNSRNVSFPDARSRGLLCMDLLAQHSAMEAAAFLRDHQSAYNPFAAVVADLKSIYVAYNDGAKILTQRLGDGLHVFSSAAEFDLHSAKADRAYALFGRASEKLRQDTDASLDTVVPLHSVLGDHSLPAGSFDPGEAICVHRDSSGTVSSSIVALASSGSRYEMFHCPGPPCRNKFGASFPLEIRER